jgi:hypothetical protein
MKESGSRMKQHGCGLKQAGSRMKEAGGRMTEGSGGMNEAGIGLKEAGGGLVMKDIAGGSLAAGTFAVTRIDDISIETKNLGQMAWGLDCGDSL